jgi:sRNA-binding regulator protein Hfq
MSFEQPHDQSSAPGARAWAHTSTVRPILSVKPGGLRGPAPSAKPTGHEVVLKAIAKDKREVTLVTLAGDVEQGALVAFDKYTLSIEQGPKVTVFFKHALESFSSERPVKADDSSSN